MRSSSTWPTISVTGLQNTRSYILVYLQESENRNPHVQKRRIQQSEKCVVFGFGPRMSIHYTAEALLSIANFSSLLHVDTTSIIHWNGYTNISTLISQHVDVIIRKRSPHNLSFVRGRGWICRSLVDFCHKGPTMRRFHSVANLNTLLNKQSSDRLSETFWRRVTSCDAAYHNSHCVTEPKFAQTKSWVTASEVNSLRPCDSYHDDVIKLKHFAHCWPFVVGIHRPPVN